MQQGEALFPGRVSAATHLQGPPGGLTRSEVRAPREASAQRRQEARAQWRLSTSSAALGDSLSQLSCKMETLVCPASLPPGRQDVSSVQPALSEPTLVAAQGPQRGQRWFLFSKSSQTRASAGDSQSYEAGRSPQQALTAGTRTTVQCLSRHIHVRGLSLLGRKPRTERILHCEL